MLTALLFDDRLRTQPTLGGSGWRGCSAGGSAHLAPWLAGRLLVLTPWCWLAAAANLALVLAAACIAHAARLLLWQPWKTRRVPLVWVLHAAYLWIPLHLALRALAECGIGSPSAATHALTVGAAGGLIIGMMTRTARPLRADRVDTTCYALVLAAALVRVALPLFRPELTLPAVQGSALLWSAGFGLYAVRYWPVLTRPRLDGRRG